MLSSAQLAATQATANAALDKSITVKRVVRVQGSDGHYSESWSTLETVNGNLSQPTGTQMQNYNYLVGPLNTWQVRLPAGTTVAENDRLVIGSQTLRVQVVLQPQSYQTSLRLLASEIEGEAV